MDGVAHRLGAAPEILGYPRRASSPSAGQKDLAAPEDEGIGGAQLRLQGLALLLRKRTYEYGRFHGHYCNSSLTTCSEDALGLDPGREAHDHGARTTCPNIPTDCTIHERWRRT